MKMSKTHRKLKIALWIVGIIVALVLIGAVTLAVLARQAVSDYRGAATTQLNEAVAGKTTGLPVELRAVWFGDVLSSDYQRVKNLNSVYQKLLRDVKSYVAVLNAHNVLVEQYNAGIKGNKPMGGDLLKSVNKYQAVMMNLFPDEKDQIKAIGDLLTQITSNTDFDAVSTSIDDVLQTGDDFLAQFREQLNARITEFQKKVN